MDDIDFQAIKNMSVDELVEDCIKNKVTCEQIWQSVTATFGPKGFQEAINWCLKRRATRDRKIDECLEELNNE